MFGCKVVNAQFPTLARLLLKALSNVLFPAFGNPTSPTSASNFSSSSSVIVNPCSPLVANFGLGTVFVTKCGFPNPPTAPAASKIGLSIGRLRSKETGDFAWAILNALFLALGKRGKSAVAISSGVMAGYRSHFSRLHFHGPFSSTPSSFPASIFFLSSSIATGSILSISLITVPTGTNIVISSPLSPPRVLPCPFFPLPAFMFVRRASLCKEVSPRTAWI